MTVVSTLTRWSARSEPNEDREGYNCYIYYDEQLLGSLDCLRDMGSYEDNGGYTREINSRILRWLDQVWEISGEYSDY